MMHNPFQSYQTDPTLAAYAGFSSPYGLQTPQVNPSVNPIAAALGAACSTSGLSPLGQTGYAGMQGYGGIHPQQLLQLASLLASQAGIPQAYGIPNPYVSAFQNPWIGQQNPLLTAGIQNPLLQNPLLQNPLLQNPLLQNPLLTAVLQNPLLAASLQNPQVGHHHLGQLGGQFGPQQYSPFGQQLGSPFGQQIGSPFGQQQFSPYGQIGTLAPQTWVGQGGLGSQINPLIAQQLASRLFQTPGLTPWAGF